MLCENKTFSVCATPISCEVEHVILAPVHLPLIKLVYNADIIKEIELKRSVSLPPGLMSLGVFYLL